MLSRSDLQPWVYDDHPIAPRSPWQNGHAERLIGSIRRECLDHIVVFAEPSAPDPCGLRRLLQRTANASVSEQGFAGPSANRLVSSCSADPRRAAPSIPPDVVFSRDSYTPSSNSRKCSRSRVRPVV
ncbi:integrase core domain-containing protein [Reyranella soli]|uniref:integrase core domain-containing protein n=1 Tax=Reyranella soli TaxID=1230389 RepID=UPI0035A230F9